MIKNITTSNTNWVMFDVMRGMPATSGSTAVRLDANLSMAENPNNSVEPSPTGFTPTQAGSYTNASGGTYVYMAIRRPHKPPTAGTDVFKVQTSSSNDLSLSSLNAYSDLVLTRKLESSNTVYNSAFVDRLRGNKQILTSSQTTLESNFSGSNPDLELVGLEFPFQRIDSEQMAFYSFKRAPGFFDAVAYTGTGSSRSLSHNLGAVPELIIQKRRSSNGEWHVFADSVTSPNSAWYLNFGNLNRTYSLENNFGSTGISGAPTSTVIPLGSNSNLNGNTSTFFMYLFASLDGISKVGSYSGTGSNINVDCGFTAGARFVLIKRIDSSSDWYVWDTARGIVSGNDPYFLLNSFLDSDGTNVDYIDPLNAGFTVTSSAPAALNASGGTYLFLAIA